MRTNRATLASTPRNNNYKLINSNANNKNESDNNSFPHLRKKLPKTEAKIEEDYTSRGRGDRAAT